MFDRDLTREIAFAWDDRDRAPFFAGRKKEIATFDNATIMASRKDQAVFRIYQGPPGCGKTSLAKHLADIRPDDTLFVPCEAADLLDTTSLLKRIRMTAVARRSSVERATSTALLSVAEYLNTGTLQEAVRDIATETARRGATVVLHMDEAHTRTEVAEGMLRSLHTIGLGTPCVVMLTGLGHTRSNIGAIEGLTRVSEESTYNLPPMHPKECAQSTRMLLETVGVTGEGSESIARLTAELSHNWPQHLNRAQKALCEELLRADGHLPAVDIGRVRKRSDDMRREYYDARLRDHPALTANPALTCRLLVDVAAESPKARTDLVRLCQRAMDRAGLSDVLHECGVGATTLANALEEKGILTDADKHWAVAIPSMLDWAAAEIGDTSQGDQDRVARSRANVR